MQLRSLRSEEHTSELQSLRHLVCRLLLEKKKRKWRRSCLERSDSGGQTTGDGRTRRSSDLELIPLLLCVSQQLARAHSFYLFFFNDTATTEIYTLSLHDAFPI